jgi:hypothetical protein
MRSRDPLPFEKLGTHAPMRTALLERETTRMLSEGWFRAGFGPVSYARPIDWSHHNRSFRFYLQAWDLLDPVLLAHSASGKDSYYKAALPVAVDWIERYQLAAYSDDLADLTEYVPGADEHFVWYDMAVGQRAYRLAYILDVAARDPEVTAHTFEQLANSVLFHCHMLMLPSFFRAHSNHGFYQAMGLAATVRRLGDYASSRGWDAVAREQVEIAVDAQFFPEGMHREHSPAYHRMVFGSLLNARRSHLLPAETDTLALRAEEALNWTVMTDGTVANFGDSDLVTPRVVQLSPRFGVRHYPESGYGFARIPAAENATGDSYLAQLSAFHSRVHKHSDHMTFIWQDRGLPILGDSGRYGYSGRTKKGDELWKQGFWYEDPRRIYCESTSAHNCVEVDGRSYRRTRNDPFGPALRQAEQQGDLVVFHSEANYRYLRLWQRRTLVLLPGKFLVCLDTMIGKEERTFRQWFQLDPIWNAEVQDGKLTARSAELEIHACDLLDGSELSPVISGQSEPMQGWLSREENHIEPRPSFHARRNGPNVSFATVFSLEGPVTRDTGNRVNVSGRIGRLSWHIPGATRQLTLGREGQLVKVALT